MTVEEVLQMINERIVHLKLDLWEESDDYFEGAFNTLKNLRDAIYEKMR